MKLKIMKFKISAEPDIYFVQSNLSKISESVGYDNVEMNKLKTIISELAYNILKYAKTGFIVIEQFEERGEIGVIVKAEDQGPGIPNIEEALKDNYSSSGTLGLGLPGIKRMADYIKINSTINVGTEVIVKFWKK